MMEAGGRTLPFSRWWLVTAGALCMGIAGTYQFVWSSIRSPLGVQLGASETALGTVFTVFVVFQTVSQFPAGWVRDRYGPTWPLVVGAGLLAAGYAGTASAGTVALVYLSYGVGGVGAGIVYTVAVNTPVKWFTDRRGLATGIVGVTYGGVSFLLIPAIRRGVSNRFELTLFALAGLSALAVLVAAIVIRDPPELRDGGRGDRGERGEGTNDDGADAEAGGDGPDGRPPADGFETRGAERPYTWRATIRTWQFWFLYVAFVVVNGVGLMLIGKAVTFADQFGLAPAIATAGASAVAISDAGGVLGGGWLSDRLGAIRTSAGTLVLCGVALGGAILAGQGGFGPAFVVLLGAAAFFRAPVFVIFPGIIGDFYGESHSSANYALLYSSKLLGGVYGGSVASGLVITLGWSETFALGALLMVAAGVTVSFVRPV